MFNESNYLQSPLLKTFISAKTAVHNQEDQQAIFSTFNYMGHVKIGKCNDWTQFISSNFAMWNGLYEYLTIEASFGKSETASNINSDPPVTTQNFSCSNSGAVKKIVNSLYVGRPIKVDCNGHAWKTFSNSKSGTVFCVDCSNSYNSSSCANEGSTVNPCQGYDGICKKHEASYAILQFKRKEITLFPIFSKLLSATSFENKLTIHADIVGEGTVFCAAYDTTSCSLPTSTVDIKNSGFASTTTVGSVVSSVEVVILGLFAETTYRIYCGTSDFQLHAMDIDTVRNHSINATTTCCKRIVFDTANMTDLTMFSSVPSQASPSVRFHLNSVPDALISVEISLSSRFCGNDSVSNKYRVNSSIIAVHPSSFNFKNDSLPTSGSFVVDAPPGCYIITARARHYAMAQLYVSIQNSSRPLSPPSLVSASFSDDALWVNLHFSSPTDKGRNLLAQPESYFPCNKLIILHNNLSATCQWISSTHLAAIISPSMLEVPIIRVGDTVQVRDGAIRSYCKGSVPTSICNQYPYARSSAAVIIAPLRPIIPIVSIIGPQVTGMNTLLTIDPTGSSGRGAQPWLAISWTVGSSIWSTISTSRLSNYLSAAYKSTDKVIIIPATYLAIGSFEITLILTNCFGMSSSNTIEIEVFVNFSAPTVTILGPQVLYTKRWQPLQVVANISYSQGLKYGSRTIFKWTLYDFYGVVPVLSKSRDPSHFVLPSGVLNVSTTYFLSLVVYNNITMLDSSLSSLTIYVESSGVVANIVGGDSRSSDIFQAVYINASSSYDMDYPSNRRLMYTWSCVQIYPSYNGPCTDLYPASIFADKSQPILKLNPHLSAAVKSFTNYFAIFNVSVVVTNDMCRQSEAYTLLSIFPTFLPQFLIFPESKKYSSASKIVFSGEVSNIGGHQSITVLWEVKGLNITSLALTPTQATVGSNSSMLFQIALRPCSLSAGMPYTFRLTSPDTKAFAEYEIKINSPPYSGVLSVQPQVGFEIHTIFSFLSTSWLTEEDNYPLLYRFSYFDMDASSQVSLSQESLVPYISSMLSRGLPTTNYTIYCAVIVADTYGATANASTKVKVFPATSNVSSTYLNYDGKLRSAVSSRDSTIIVDTISVIANSLTIKNCSATPNCTELNRQGCRSTSNTCGSCLIGYVGIYGDSNTYCGHPNLLLRIGEKCSNSTPCISNTCLDGVCADTAKSCVNDCSGRGDCVYHSYYHEEQLSKCTNGNSTCYARCNCEEGSFGEDCSMTRKLFVLSEQLHDGLCMSFLSMLQWQSVSPSIIRGRANTVSNILMDSSLLTTAGFQSCVNVLSQSAMDYASLPPDQSVMASLLMGLDMALKYTRIPLNLSSSIHTAISLLVRSNQKLMVPSETPFKMTASSLSILSVVNSMDSLQNNRYSMPQSAYDAFNGRPPSSVGLLFQGGKSNRLLMTSSSSTPPPIVGLILTQYLTNPRGGVGFFSDIVVESVIVDEDYKTVDILLDYSLQRVGLSVPASNLSDSMLIHCPASRTASNVSLVCPDRIQYSVACPASLLSHPMNVTCPRTTRTDVCATWNGRYFAASGHCAVIQKSSSNLSCACSANISSKYYYSSELTSRYLEHVRPIQYTLLPSTDPGMKRVGQSAIISIATTAIAVCLIVLFCLHMRWFSYSYAEMKIAKNMPFIRTLTSFFSQCIPSEFEVKSPVKLFIMKLSENHCYFRLVHLRKLNRDVLLFALIRLTNYLLVGTMLVLYFFDDVFNPCAHRISAQSCTDAHIASSVCKWNSITLSCSYLAPPVSVPVIIILFVSIVFIHIVMEVMVNICVGLVEAYCNVGKHFPTTDDTGLKTVAKYDELVDVQNKRSNFIRAVALTGMKLESDSVNVMGEIKNMLEHRESYLPEGNLQRRNTEDKINNFFEFYGSNAVPYSRADFLREVEKSPSAMLSVLERLKESRQEAESIKHELLSQFSDVDRDVQLMKHFLCGFLKGYKSSIVKIAMFLSNHVMQVEDIDTSQVNLLRTVSSLSYIVAAFGCIIYMGLNVNDAVASVWIIVSILAVLQDAFFILPMDIYLRYLFIPSLARFDFLAVYDVLSRRARTIISRNSMDTCSAMKISRNLIQHFHPACRAARLFPHLPVSRLLFSITDYDLPISHLLATTSTSDNSRRKRPFNCVEIFCASVLEIFILLTANKRLYWTQSSLLQFFIAFSLNGLIVALYLSTLTGTAATVAISIICSVTVAAFVHYLFPKLLWNRIYSSKYGYFCSTDGETVNKSESVYKSLEISIDPMSKDNTDYSAFYNSPIRTKTSSTITIKSSTTLLNTARKSRVTISDDVSFFDDDLMNDPSMLQPSIKQPIRIGGHSTPIKSILKKKNSMVFVDSVIDNKSNMDDKDGHTIQNNLDADDAGSLQSGDSLSNLAYSGYFDDPMAYLNGPFQSSTKYVVEDDEEEEEDDDDDEDDQYEGESDGERQRRVAAKIRSRLPGFRKVKSQRVQRPAVGVPMSKKKLASKISSLQRQAVADSSNGLSPVEAAGGYSRISILSRLDAINKAHNISLVAETFSGPSSKKRSVAFDIEPKYSDRGDENIQIQKPEENIGVSSRMKPTQPLHIAGQIYSGKSRTYLYDDDDHSFDHCIDERSSKYSEFIDGKPLSIKSILKKENHDTVHDSIANNSNLDDHEADRKRDTINKGDDDARSQSSVQSADSSSLSSRSSSIYSDEFTDYSNSTIQSVHYGVGEREEHQYQKESVESVESVDVGVVQRRVAAAQAPSPHVPGLQNNVNVQRRRRPSAGVPLSKEKLIAALKRHAAAVLPNIYTTSAVDSSMDPMAVGKLSSSDNANVSPGLHPSYDGTEKDWQPSLSGDLAEGSADMDPVVYKFPFPNKPLLRDSISSRSPVGNPLYATGSIHSSFRDSFSMEKPLPPLIIEPPFIDLTMIARKKSSPLGRPTFNNTSKSETVGSASDAIVPPSTVLGVPVDIPKTPPVVRPVVDDKVITREHHLMVNGPTSINSGRVNHLFVDTEANYMGDDDKASSKTDFINSHSSKTVANVDMNYKPPPSPSNSNRNKQNQQSSKAAAAAPRAMVQGPKLEDIRSLQKWKVSNSPPPSESSSIGSSSASFAQPKVEEISSGTMVSSGLGTKEALDDGPGGATTSSKSFSVNSSAAMIREASKDLHSLHTVKLEPLHHSAALHNNDNDRKK